MWIRSQDKKDLLNAHRRIHAVDQAVYADSMRIGRYKTNERALEVVDMIQNQLVVGSSSDVILHGKRIMQENVFQMPEK
ncbi:MULTISPECIES: hypothetical protein [Clostridium]|uniref:hypothetical protein n=1 Tax=Clostridium TaxID=1485 RepID=UPI00069F2C26|nr:MULTISPECIES: hypothetical protein [Clostridium]KOF56643.1 hypothetical protein AGR56_07900 [Clostridium sp. DMHC 10]MCD2348111.1 hypothetical protein [Clostridium guangxiense]